MSDKKQVLTEKEREALAKKLDDDLESYITGLETSASRKYEDGWNEENWEAEMEKHPFFASQLKNPEESVELNPLMKGIRDLKFCPNENTYEELGLSYKEEGNFHFKNKKYRLAVANYTEGLRLKIGDSVLNTQLLTNRAAAQFHIGNYRSSLMDCRFALKVTPDHFKAIVRGAQCCSKLKRPDECIEWCNKGLSISPDDKVLSDLKKSSQEMKKTTERDHRKQLAKEKKQKKEEQSLLDAIRSRGITLSLPHRDKDDEEEDEGKNENLLDLASLEPSHPAAINKRVHFVEEEGEIKLAWPVLFMYPEHSETDFIEEFQEDHVFEDHLVAMFGVGIERPPWDTTNKYIPHKLCIYFEDRLNVHKSPKLVSVSKKSTLLDVLKDPRYKVMGGTPAFIVLVKGSAFQEDFLSKYQ